MFAESHLYVGVALAGLASFLSPCVLPLVPPYLGYLGGTTLDQLTTARNEDRHLWRRVILASLLFVLGFTTVFVGLGAGASYFGQLMQTYKNELTMVAGVIIIFFGLHFLGILRIPLLYSDTRFQADTSGATLVGAYLIGLAFAFGWTPCIGPVLATVLTLAANEASLGAGVRLLAIYSLGLGVPFVAAAIAIGPFLSFMRRYRRHLGLFEKVMGVVLVIAGLMFLTGTLNTFGNRLLDTFPELQQVEAWVTPETLPGDILKQKPPAGATP